MKTHVCALVGVLVCVCVCVCGWERERERERERKTDVERFWFEAHADAQFDECLHCWVIADSMGHSTCINTNAWCFEFINTHVYALGCARVGVWVWVCVCMYVWVLVCERESVCVFVCERESVCVCMCVRMYVCVCVYSCVYVCVYWTWSLPSCQRRVSRPPMKSASQLDIFTATGKGPSYKTFVYELNISSP